MKATIDRTRTIAEQALHGTLLLAGWNFIAVDLEPYEDDYDVYCADGKDFGSATWELAFFGANHPVSSRRWRLTYWGGGIAKGDPRRWYSNDPQVAYVNYRRQRELVETEGTTQEELLT